MHRIRLSVAVVLMGAALAGCSDDPASACFKRGDHDNMSDGKITRICDCALKQSGAATLSEAERGTLVDVIHGRSVKAGEEARHRAIMGRWSAALQSCKALS